MTSDNFVRALAIIGKQQPFRPYTIQLHSGRELRVIHPEAVVFRDGMAYYVCTEEPERLFLFDHDCVSVVFEEEEGKPRPAQ